MPGNRAVEFRGGKDFARELRSMDTAWGKELAVAHRKIAQRVAGVAQSYARRMSRMQAAAAKAIKGKATATAASIGVANTTQVPFAQAAFWGALRHTGWYAQMRFNDGPDQFPPWVTNTWQAGVRGQGPYAINDSVATESGRIVEDMGDMVDDIAARAFPT